MSANSSTGNKNFESFFAELEWILSLRKQNNQ